MALPRVNEVLKFSLTIPSTGQTVRYRPYLVKEEKVLLQAFESKDMKACLDAMCDTIESCIDDEVNMRSLATFDIEYMFLKLRSKSVGEVSDILIPCKECSHRIEHSVDIDQIKVEVDNSDNLIDITDTIKVEMKYPSFSDVGTMVEDIENFENAVEVVANCIRAVHTDEERYDCLGLPKHEVISFLENLTATQMKKVITFLDDMPSLKHDIKVQCPSCSHENELTLKGLTDFF